MRVKLLVLSAVMVTAGAACGSSDVSASTDASQEVAPTTTAVAVAADRDVASVESDDTEVGDVGRTEGESGVTGFLAGTRADLPPVFVIPAPAGGQIISTIESNEAYSASLTYEEGLFDEIVAFYEAWAAGSGEPWESWVNEFDEVSETGTVMRRQAVWTDDPEALGASTTTSFSVGTCNDNRPDADGGVAVCVHINQPKTG